MGFINKLYFKNILIKSIDPSMKYMMMLKIINKSHNPPVL